MLLCGVVLINLDSAGNVVHLLEMAFSVVTNTNAGMGLLYHMEYLT